jgi:hypothetical protein
MSADRLAAALADRCRIERRLGAGDMATVWLARDLRHDREVAIKVLHPELGAALGAERFLFEIKTTARRRRCARFPTAGTCSSRAPIGARRSGSWISPNAAARGSATRTICAPFPWTASAWCSPRRTANSSGRASTRGGCAARHARLPRPCAGAVLRSVHGGPHR